MGGAAGLSIEELADHAGVSVRTVRYYISQGLLPGPGARGKSASYGEDHLARLRLIRRLAEQHVPLAEQRERLARLSADDLHALLREEDHASRALEQARAAESPRDYVSRLLARARSTTAYPVVERPVVSRPSPWPRVQPEHVQRWELAPGVELLVRGDAARRYPHVIEWLLETASGQAAQRARHPAGVSPGRRGPADRFAVHK